MKIRYIIVFWVICGLLAAGGENAYFARKWDLCNGKEDLGNSLIRGLLLGPISLIVSVFSTGFFEYGWSLQVLNNPTCPSKKRSY